VGARGNRVQSQVFNKSCLLDRLRVKYKKESRTDKNLYSLTIGTKLALGSATWLENTLRLIWRRPVRQRSNTAPKSQFLSEKIPVISERTVYQRSSQVQSVSGDKKEREIERQPLRENEFSKKEEHSLPFWFG